MPGKTTANNKTKPEKTSVREYIASVENQGRREDAQVILKMMRDITGMKPVMWGATLVGFGKYHYRYESGREGDAFLVGFAPRKANMVVYIMPGFSDYGGLLKRLGKYKTGSSCLYLGRLSNIDLEVLAELITASFEHMQKKYKTAK